MVFMLGLVVFFVLATSSLTAQVGPVALFYAVAVLLASVLLALVLLLRRRLILFEHGFTATFVRLRETLGPAPFVPYHAVVSVKLSRPEGLWVWRVETRDHRRILIPEWVFRDRERVHTFLKGKLPLAVENP
ncbi:MAG TPA: hypothetical protein VJ397_06615 [Thermoplasmata archaeon]|nr:hypothetical protein [Thermoplasmata archaeon]